MENYRAKIPFRYDIVGSFLRPERLKEARAAFADGAISREELTRVEDEEIRTFIEQQKKAGLKAVTDGEFRRRWWHLDFLSYLNGITVYDFESSAFGVTAKIYRQLLTELENLGVKPIEAVGKEFDPNFHNAVMQVENAELEPGTSLPGPLSVYQGGSR